MEKHTKEEHTSFQCNSCNFDAKGPEEFNKHMKTSHIEEPTLMYKNCSLCGYKALSDADLKAHKQTIHESQVLLLRAVRELTENVKTLTADVFYLKSNSIIIDST